MWNITKEAKEQFLTHNLLPIHESDDDWDSVLREAQEEGEDLLASLKEDLDEVKGQLFQVLPDRFIPYLENGTLNQPTLPKTVREDYLQWMREADQKFEQMLEAANERKEQAIPYLSTPVQDVFRESFHDSTIERIERDANTLHLYINTDGGFSTMSLIHLVFKDITSEETDEAIQVGQWFIYDELQKTAGGFAFRVLFECPESEWTITMEDIDAQFFYHPKEYTRLRDEDRIDNTSIAEYIGALNCEYRYWLITPHVKCAIQSLSKNIVIENGIIEFEKNNMVITVENERFTYDLNEYNPINFIYTDIYEDPYAHFNEPVPRKEIEYAVLGENLELQVRAWNTIYANPHEYADIINHVLGEIEINEENEMMLTVYVDHFYKEDILTAAIIEKYCKFID